MHKYTQNELYAGTLIFKKFIVCVRLIAFTGMIQALTNIWLTVG